MRAGERTAIWTGWDGIVVPYERGIDYGMDPLRAEGDGTSLTRVDFGSQRPFPFGGGGSG